MQARVSRCRLALFVVGVASLFASAPAPASIQVGVDPADVPPGPSGVADVRMVTWNVGSNTATLSVELTDSTYTECVPTCTDVPAHIGFHVLLDAGTDGIADAEISGERAADGIAMDMSVNALSGTGSGADCQVLDGIVATSATVSTTHASGRETVSYTFDPTEVPGELDAFRWGVFSQAPPAGSSGGPWDIAPDSADPSPSSVNPGDRRCGPALGGVQVRLADGAAFPDAIPPRTAIDSATIMQARRKATFKFHSSEPVSTFECSLDQRAFTACTARKVYRQLTVGKHTFRVRALDAAGNSDPTPAKRKFEMRR